ncbi:MAG: hypothetical protein H6703_11730 [Myxococcales bacterium]|nr:hypothetical protein [Myxococcales bacterium]MCB9553773.1 hypothetical protein [Myxococcales bacterium]
MKPARPPLPSFARVGITLAVAALAGCLGDPEPRTCADYPPGTPGCGSDGGSADGRAPDATDPDFDPPDADRPDADRPDADPRDATAPDATGSDAAPDPDAGPDLGPAGPCEPNPCAAPPDALCLADRVLQPAPARCLPLECAPGDLDCDPGVLQCAALLSCRLGCFFDRDFDACDAACVAAAPAEAITRYDAVSACSRDSGCEDGEGQFDCLRAACADEIAACTGDPAIVWFIRQRFPARGRVCDYPVEFGADCAALGQRCQGGACVDAPDPCADVDCSVAPAPACDGDRVVVTREPGVCDPSQPGPACVYPEARMECPPERTCDRGACVDPPCERICDGRLIVSCDAANTPTAIPCDRSARCVGGTCRAIPDAHGIACRDAASTTACERAGFQCGGVAAVPRCMLEGGPFRAGLPCLAAVDCELGLLCTLAGRCSTGARGSACLEDADCETACGRAGTCL